MTTKTPNREQVQELVDKLTDKTLSFGCRILAKDIDTEFVIRGKNVGTPYVVVYNRGIPRIKEISESESNIKVLGHPILIGDVLGRIPKDYNVAGEKTTTPEKETSYTLISKWAKCGFTLSLQSIIEDSGWEEEDFAPIGVASLIDYKFEPFLKSESARNLVEFIYNLNL